MNFDRYDIVRYDTGTTYMVSRQMSPENVLVTGWKNGKPFGPIRTIKVARCIKIGKTSSDGFPFTPEAV